jgi:uncharacterized protein
MLYTIICADKPGQLATRKTTRDAHLAYIDETGVVTQAGPLLDAGGEMCGSLIIIDVENQAAAESWAAGDPYATAGLFEKVEIRPWRRVIG